jgi:energy-coupling factor transporter ATP-binding protein EcfA2
MAVIAEAPDLIAAVEALGGRMAEARGQIARAIHGQTEVVDQTLITLLSGGHVLLVGVPGLGKSRLVETLGVVMGLATKRVQFTPDLMPADILGSEVLEEDEHGRRSFRFVPGPVFCQLLMADEINRASPRTQSALLQAMQEGRVSVAGVEHVLPLPFHVLATQNPIEQEGTYPLPEAQLDRFLLEIEVRYPDLAAERSMLIATTGVAEQRPVAALSPEALMAAQSLGALEGLSFEGHCLGDDGFEVLAKLAGVVFRELRSLSFEVETVTERGLRVVAGRKWFAQLESFSLTSARAVGPGGVEALLTSSRPLALRSLTLNDVNARSEGAITLSKSTQLAPLRTLGLASNRIGLPGAQALLESPTLAKVRIDLQGNGLSAQVVARAASER